MDHEIKIFIKCSTESIDHDGKPPIPAKINVYLDDHSIGGIQDIKFHASADPNENVQLEFIFWDGLYNATSTEGAWYYGIIQKLSKIPGIVVTMKSAR